MAIIKEYRHLCLAVLLTATMSATGAKTVKTVNPWVDNTNTAKLFIDAVELTPDSTTVTLHTYSYLGSNINIQPGVKLVHDGKNYPLRSAKGIDLGKRIDIPALGDSIFTLSFEPLPMKTKTFDFVEGDEDNYFKLWGVHTDKSFDSQTPIENLKELPQQKWEKGTAVLKGKIVNYHPSEDNTLVNVYPRSAIGHRIDKNIGVGPVNPDGSFEVELPLFQSYQPCFFTAPGFYGLIYLSPDKESYVTIDQSLRNSSGFNGKDGSVIFAGANDELNNQLALNIGHDMVWDSFFNNVSREKKYSSAAEYKADVTGHTERRKEKIKRLPFTPLMKQLMEVNIENDMALALLDRMTSRSLEDNESTYYNFLTNVDIDDPMLMWGSSYDSFISYLYDPFPDNLRIRTTNISPDYYTYLIDNCIVKGNDAELARSLANNNIDRLPKEIVDEYAQVAIGRVIHYRDSLDLQGPERTRSEQLIDLLKSGELKKYNDVKSHYLNWLFNTINSGHQFSLQEAADIPYENDIITEISKFREDNDSIINAFTEKYEPYYYEWNFEKDIDTGIENLEKRYGKKSEIINQLFASNAYINHIDRRNILTEGYIANCRKRMSDMFFEYVMDQNSAMAKVLEGAKSNILEMNPENSGDQVLKDLAEKFKGKVIYIDLWGTWCSPCLNAITEIQPVKKDYADDVAFVYLADETSPQKAWEDKIKSIDGEHMRLSQAQAQDIKSKFALSGYPSYIVIGKDGSVTYSGFIHGLDNVRKILDEAIAK